MLYNFGGGQLRSKLFYNYKLTLNKAKSTLQLEVATS